MRKRVLLMAVASMFVLSLSGCGSDKDEKSNKATTEMSETESVTTVEATADTVTEIATESTEITTEATQTTGKDGPVMGDDLGESQEYYESMYREILDANYSIVTGGMDNYDYIDGTSGIGEVVMNGSENAMDIIGYTFVDSNNDGVAELIIGAINQEKDGRYYGENIYSVYTHKVNPCLILEGWSRNRCFLLDDGTFYSEGSNGAMYNVYENNMLGSGETELQCLDYYFTKEKDETFEEIGFYHNTMGEWEASVSEELDEEEYWSIAEAYDDRTIIMEFTPFSNYEYVGDEATIVEAAVTVEWITKEQMQSGQIDNFVADTSEPQVIAAIYANENIRNLKVLSLTFENVDDMGNTYFSIEELYNYGELEPGNSFSITCTMYGTIPTYGISYETGDGITHYYAINESGMDGSAVLVDFVPTNN